MCAAIYIIDYIRRWNEETGSRVQVWFFIAFCNSREDFYLLGFAVNRGEYADEINDTCRAL